VCSEARRRGIGTKEIGHQWHVSGHAGVHERSGFWDTSDHKGDVSDWDATEEDLPGRHLDVEERVVDADVPNLQF
jgi:hypothetical protein